MSNWLLNKGTARTTSIMQPIARLGKGRWCAAFARAFAGIVALTALLACSCGPTKFEGKTPDGDEQTKTNPEIVVVVTPDFPSTSDTLVCTVTTSDIESNEEIATCQYQWYRNDVVQSGLTGTTVDAGLTSKGEVWKCVVTATYDTNGTTSGSDAVTIANGLPSAPVVYIAPHAPLTTENLVCAITTPSVDPDGDALTYTYRWYKGYILQSGIITNTVDSAYTTKGDVWRCAVSYSDGTDNGASGADEVTIADGVSTAPGVHIAPHAPCTTDNLVCAITTPSTDLDGDPITYTYNWYRNGVLHSGLTSNTVDSAYTAKGEVWKCIVTAGSGTSTSASASDEVTIANSAPSAPVVQITPQLPTGSSSLVCSIATASTDPDGDTLTYTYKWYKNDVLQPSLASSTVNSSYTADGEVWKCEVAANDGTITGMGGCDEVTVADAAIIIDHRHRNLNSIPEEWITKAKTDLHIAYGHTSHGSQITTGMTGLVGFAGGLYSWNNGGTGGALDLKDFYENFGGLGIANDLGNPNRTAWEQATRQYLDSHPSINVIMWSWCGQVGTATEANINTYLDLMSGLEEDYPNVKFVYMTGHTNGTGLSGTLHVRNQQIRDYCLANDKILYDFEDIESYDPDGDYFGDNYVEDDCDYDGGNWAEEWQDSHEEGVDWYDCESEHSQPLNANLKAYAAWWLWARLAGWDGNPS